MPIDLPPGHFFLPGPTEVHPDVLAAQARPMIGHRGHAIEELLARLQVGLQQVFVTERPVIVSTSSATGLMEAAVRNGVAGGRVLSLVNGAFSSRFGEIAMACGHDTEVWPVDWGLFHDPEELDERLAQGGFDAVTMAHSETSTGALQDLGAIARVTGRHEGVMLLIDSVTGVAGAEVRTDDWGLDFVLTGSQKALALPPGLGFAVASPEMLDRSAEATNKGYYFDLLPLLKSLEAFQTPSTPAISLLYALEVQLERILAEGIEQRWGRHLAMQQATSDWVDTMQADGVDVGVLAPLGHRSPTVTCITLPDGTSGPSVVAAMRESGWVIGAGYSRLKESTIRIGHMGDHRPEVLSELLESLGRVLR
ncbi:MAG: pyridoxal-phosphate-dependent aminotransferase family protein [Acidimicrobiia bacterium]